MGEKWFSQPVSILLLVSGSVAPVAYGEEPDQYYLMPGTPSPLPANSVNVDVLQNLPPSYRKPGPIRVPLPEDHWQMSAADCTQGLGRNIDGTDIAAMPETEWQVSHLVICLSLNYSLLYSPLV